MTRFVAGLEYKGTGYSGWQKQHSQIMTIADHIEQALSRVANHPIKIIAAGRTDKGVHATQQVIHFDSDSERQAHHWLRGANSYLPYGMRLSWAASTHDTFHARFSATYRRYVYLIYNHKNEPGLLREYCDWQYLPLDIEAMAQAAKSLIGYHDFNAFRSTDCQSPTSQRQIDSACITKSQRWIMFDIQANAFLHKMVRMLVAELIAIGKGQHPPERMMHLIQLGHRQHKPVARPSGLFLTEVGYPEKWQLPIGATEDQWIHQLAAKR